MCLFLKTRIRTENRKIAEILGRSDFNCVYGLLCKAAMLWIKLAGKPMFTISGLLSSDSTAFRVAPIFLAGNEAPAKTYSIGPTLERPRPSVRSSASPSPPSAVSIPPTITILRGQFNKSVSFDNNFDNQYISVFISIEIWLSGTFNLNICPGEPLWLRGKVMRK
jgi:hypothetical protein